MGAATEAAADGINLQFCNLVVNFLNKKNAADVRVYQLLDEKFRLFDGVFGASDEVLGAVESGVDFEKRIAGIYQQCRTTEQIQFEFDQLQLDLEAQISSGQRDAREKLLDNFDQEVVEKVRIESHAMLDRFNDQLGRLTRHVLAGHASFAEDGFGFRLHTNPFPGETINPGPYRQHLPRGSSAGATRAGARSGARTRASGRGTRLRREWQEHRDPRAAARPLRLACLCTREHERAGERGPARLRRGQRRR